MPVGAPFESHVEPYSQIRVDDFTNTTYRPAWINLLSHIHSDHTQGLNAPSFSLQVVCSRDSKSMLLLLESVDNRIKFDNGVISQRKRAFAALQRSGKNHRDLLFTLPLNVPTKLDIGPSETAIVTLLDANHCPGSVMFLIEGKRGAILHTGDMRAEPAMVSRLARSVHMAPYLFTNGQQEKQLEVVYLDTASFIGTQIVPSKASAVQGLVDMIGMYPEDTLFYINIWTWGYEDILIGIAERFDTKIHVDRHKYLVLCSIENYHSSPSFSKEARPDVFKNILTCDEHETRFHACERYNQCATCKPADPEPKRRTHRNSMAYQVPAKRVVWVNPGVITSSNWESHIQEVNDQLKEGHFVDTLKVPLSRHSTLTELQSFIALLRPKNICPTTIDPALEGLDWACLPGIFAEYLTPDGYETLRQSTMEELRKRFPGIDLTPDGMTKRVEQVLLRVGHPDLEQENAIGADEIEWTEARFQRATKTKEHIETYLPWLFGRPDVPGSKTIQDTLTKNPTRASTIAPTRPPPTIPATATTGPNELCSTCANCPTCRPKPSNLSSAESSGAETDIREIPSDLVGSGRMPLPEIGPSKAHIVDSSRLPAQRNEQMYSPPLESPKLGPDSETPALGTSTTTVLSARPRKRLRTSTATLPHSSSLVVKLPEIIESSSTLLLHRTQTMPDLGAPLTPAQLNPKTDVLKKGLESLSKNPATLDNSQNASRPNLVPNGEHQAHDAHPTQTVAELLSKPCSQDARHPSDIKLISPVSTSPLTTTRDSFPFSEPDVRERRRISKVKERDIRAQLAKLPPEFSQALAATKSATRSR
ncbi:unnamed protein product [Rhizoctonia solani]|uniref:Protein artemis n=1 Tax=Rhizoctonia solani TaxID=456999 RepID=A0A8H3D8R5_9AGAM|nr:unnamed protein product [Rhizoctonia solani]